MLRVSLRSYGHCRLQQSENVCGQNENYKNKHFETKKNNVFCFLKLFFLMRFYRWKKNKLKMAKFREKVII